MNQTIDTPQSPDFYTVNEEIANTLTHGLGAVASGIGVVFLLVSAWLHGDIWQIVSAGIYSFALLLIYLVSTLYHGLRNPKTKGVFRRLDHASIYVMIAGSYTPFLLVSIRDAGGPWWLSLMWGMALVGVIYKLFFWKRSATVSTILYVVMGWVCVLFLRQIVAEVEPMGLWLLAAGGAAYTLGVPFFALDRLPYNHAIWHVFVLAGSAFHYFSILFFVVR